MQFTMMFHYGRCGSKILARLIEQVSETICLPEILLYNEEKNWKPLGDFRVEDGSRVDPWSLRGAIERRVNELTSGEKIPVIGELTDSDITHARLACEFGTTGQYLKALQPQQILYLRRRNTLKLILSHRIAHETNAWHSRTSVEIPTTVHLDPEWLREEMYSRWQRERTIEHSMSQAGHDVITCVYEDRLEKNPIEGTQWVLDKLGIPVTKSLPDHLPLNRTNPFPASKNIENLKEVEELLANLSCEWMLH